jgi:Carboxypeptidase regulatory-like domain
VDPSHIPARTTGRIDSPATLPRRARHSWSLARIALLLLLPGLPSAYAQDPQPQETSPASPAPVPDLVRTAVHGVVKNAATGEPLPRALVRIEGDAVAGTLTDGEGHFEIPAVPTGPQIFQIVRPGFSDQAVAGMISTPTIVNGATNSEHNVRVAPDMPDLVFTLTPTNSIRGQIELSTGDPAQGIAVMLLRRSVQDGRAVWQAATNVRTNSDGAYRFAGLADGTYALYTEPAMDTDIPVSFVEPGSEKAATRAGYPSLFYPDSRDLAGAAKIQVAGGQRTQANFLLTEEIFHLVKAGITLPGGPRSSDADHSQLNVTVSILDPQGHQLSYSGQYDPATHTAQAFLPDGTYSLLVTAINMQVPPQVQISGPSFVNGPPAEARHLSKDLTGPMIGQVDFAVAGHAVTNLQVPLTPQRSNTLQLAMIRSGQQQDNANSFQGNPLVIMVSQAGGWITDGMVSSYAEGYAAGSIETTFMGPGSYWVHTAIPQKGVCEASFTAGGASLAREPLTLSLSGATAPLTLTLRDDCSTLFLTLPPTVETPEAGEEPHYTVYVVPDFDSTVDVTPITLRPSSGGTSIVGGLTPGSYHVYTFSSPMELEYRNAEAMAALPHPVQAVTLAPGATGHIVLEVPEH